MMQEAAGNANHPPDGDVGLHRLPDMDGGLDGHYRVADSAQVIEQLRVWLANPHRLPDVPIDWVRMLMIEYDLLRAKVDIARQEVERLRREAQYGPSLLHHKRGIYGKTFSTTMRMDGLPRAYSGWALLCCACEVQAAANR